MKFGIGLPNFGRETTWDDIRRVARAAEELGFDSVWTTDHVIVPQADAEPYGTIYESLITLALVAGVTTRIKLGASILVLPQRNPVLAAKQVATLDAATEGRVVLGVAVGWNETEYKNLGADFKNRGKRLDEAIDLLRTLFASEDATFHGDYTTLDHAVFAPLPAQKLIPIWIGGNGEPALVRAARRGDGWHATGATPAQIAAGVARLAELNPTRALTISTRLTTDLRADTPATYTYRGSSRVKLVGTLDAVRARVREYADAGAQHLTLVFPYADLPLALAQMDQFAKKIIPTFDS